jgi:hypothetical protein
MARVDDICAGTLREKRIALALAAPEVPVRALAPVLLAVDYAGTLPDGLALPLVCEVHGPTEDSYSKHEFTRVQPVSLTFVPRRGGRHVIILREAAHHRWWGSLEVEVVGSDVEQPDRPTLFFPPQISISSPASGTTLYARLDTATISGAASDLDGDGDISQVEVFADPAGTSLGIATGTTAWTLDYEPQPADAGMITAFRAVATDTVGLQGRASVAVTVEDPLAELAELCDSLCLWVGDGTAEYVRIDSSNTAPGDQADRWYSKDPLLRHAVQDTDTSQPTLATNPAWELPCLEFSSGDVMTSGCPLNNRVTVTQYIVFGGVPGTNGGQLVNPSGGGVAAYWNSYCNRVTDASWQIGHEAGLWSGSAYVFVGGYFACGEDIRGVSQVHCLCSQFNGSGAAKEDKLRLEWDTAAKALTWVWTGLPTKIDGGAGYLRVGATTASRLRLVAFTWKLHTPTERARVYELIRILCPDWTAGL